MTYAPPPGSPAAALLAHLRAGIPLPRARAAAGYTSGAALARACAEAPGLEEACTEAEKGGARAARLAELEGVAASAIVAADPSGLRALGARQEAERPRVDVGAGVDRWALARREAAAIEPGHIGTLLWIDARCQAAGMHALDAWWVDELRRFYLLCLLVFAARVGLRGGKSVSICRALVNDALFTLRDLDPGTVGVIPIMSADRTEATDRFGTIRAVLAACGIASSKGDDVARVVPGGLRGEYTSASLPSGGGVIKTVDSQGHAIEFRIYPARITGAIGYTAIGGFCDEVDLWPVDLGVSAEDVAQRSAQGKANPADVVLDRLLERFTTTLATAHLYLVSASYRGEDSAHARKIAKGDGAIQMVARLGALGSERDTVARLQLATTTGSTDARLLAPADPTSPNVPAWVTSPAATIAACYALSQDRLGPMLGRYGGRPDEAEGTRGPFAGLAFAPAPASPIFGDVVIGVAPPEGAGAWALVAVGWDGGHVQVLVDDSGDTDAGAAMRVAEALAGRLYASTLVAADGAAIAPHLWAAWAGGVPATVGLVEEDAYDGAALRVGPVRMLYATGHALHTAGLDALEADLRAWTPDGPRSPRVEALVVAVLRLTRLYWTDGGGPRPRLGRPVEMRSTGSAVVGYGGDDDER